MKKIFILLVLSTILFGCSKGQVESEANFGYMAKKELASFSEVADSSSVSDSSPVERKIIKEGWFTFETDNLGQTKDNVVKSVKKYKGYISSDSEDKYSGRITNRLVIRVPGENFDRLVDDLSRDVKAIDRKEISLRDVTEEFIDIESRLKNKKALEARYLQLLSKADTVKDILEVEREIEKLRSDIDSTEGRLKYLQKSVSYSTIDLTIYQNIKEKRFVGNRFVKSLGNGWNYLINLLVFIVSIWPFLVLAGVGLFVAKLVQKKKKA